MKIIANHLTTNIKTKNPSLKTIKDVQVSNFNQTNPLQSNSVINFHPVAFKGNAPEIKKIFMVSYDGESIPLLKTSDNNSFVVDFDSQTELIYGTDAIEFLNKSRILPYDTQVIFPKKCSAKLEIDGKEIDIKQNSALLLNKGANAKIDIKTGYPMVLITKKDYFWYDEFAKNSKNLDIQNKFLELIYYNSHLYNGDFTPNLFLKDKFKKPEFLQKLGIDKSWAGNKLIDELYQKRFMLDIEDKNEIEFKKKILEKLYDENLITYKDDNFIAFNCNYNDTYMKKELQNRHFDNEQIDAIMPIYSQAKRLHSDSKVALKNESGILSDSLICKMKQTGILFDTKKDLKHIYWTRFYPNKDLLYSELSSKQIFNEEEKQNIINAWLDNTLSGYDLSGLKFVNDDVALYNLDDKVNTWSQEETNWVSSSIEISSKKKKPPFVGVSMVQFDKKGPISMTKLRNEILHTHPDSHSRKQSEIYLVTSGVAALNIMKNGKLDVLLLKEGECVVVNPGVTHCVNSVLGEYEQIVTQVPSVFHYNGGFKIPVEISKEEQNRLDHESYRELLKF